MKLGKGFKVKPEATHQQNLCDTNMCLYLVSDRYLEDKVHGIEVQYVGRLG